MEYLAFSFYKHTFYVIYTSLDSRIACPINWNILKLILHDIAKFVYIGIFYSPSFILLLWILDMLQWFYNLYAISLSIYLMMWFHFRYFFMWFILCCQCHFNLGYFHSYNFLVMMALVIDVCGAHIMAWLHDISVGVVDAFTNELIKQFLIRFLMDVMGICYSQCWFY